VYAIISVEDENRYYVTSVARAKNDEVFTGIQVTTYVNPFQQACYKYFVRRNAASVRIDVEGYSGIADLFLGVRDEPTGPDSASIIMRAAQGPNRAFFLTPEDRTIWNVLSGEMYICVYAYTDYSAAILVDEYVPERVDDGLEFPSNFFIKENQVTTQLLPLYTGVTF
jgi:hypothetical protein